MAHIKLELFHESSNTTITRTFSLSDNDIMRFSSYLQDKFAEFSGIPPNTEKTQADIQTAVTKEFNIMIENWKREVLNFERNKEIEKIQISSFG